MAASDDPGPVDLVLEGGGVKGIGLVGALAVLRERRYTFKRLAGTSAGAIAASLVAAGYSPEELYQLLLDLEFTQFEDKTWEYGTIPILGAPASVLVEEGLFKGERFLEWITHLLEEKGVRTFADLIDPDPDDPDSRFRLTVIASDITGHRLLRLPQDAELFGTKPERLSVAEAVRMSMSIPIFFTPWRWPPSNGEDSATDHLIVDGGLLSNFPVWVFDATGREPRWPTFGLMLVEAEQREPVATRLGVPRSDTNIISYAADLVKTMLEAHDRLYLENDSFVRTITIDALGIATTDFNLTKRQKAALYESGRAAAIDFLDHRWDWERYKARYRRQAPPARSELVNAAKAATAAKTAGEESAD